MDATEAGPIARPRGGLAVSGRAGGEVFVWATGAAVTVTLAILAVLIGVIVVNGLGFFWPSPLVTAELADGRKMLGEITDREPIPGSEAKRLQFKVGNRDLYGQDYRWVDESAVHSLHRPETAVTVERTERGNFYGFVQGVAGVPEEDGGAGSGWERLRTARGAVAALRAEEDRHADTVAGLSAELQRLRQAVQDRTYRHGAALPPEGDALAEELSAAQEAFTRATDAQRAFASELRAITVTFADVSGTEITLPVAEIVRVYQPNLLSVWEKVAIYLGKLIELLTDEPREANTEGGIFPAIFGTVLMVIVMSLFCIPLGVVAGVYLREYAKDGWLVRVVRVAVFNLAGVPSIVYGVFGLGFFVYGVGGTLDQVFFPERLPTPTFGTGGLLWASLTLALLTVPVVIVATEESLAAIPRGIREGSLALAATKLQTLTRILLPMATPGIMTGLILSVARAAGEVAPLMLTGVVKLAPALPLDGTFPFLHLDRKFMHLGFHIYDVGFQSPNVEAAKPMVYMTTFLLVMIVVCLSLAAMVLRNTMRRRYQTRTF